MIDGHCIGGGLNRQLALIFELLLINPDFPCCWSMAAMIRRLINAVGVGAAKQMMFTAKSIDAQKALHLGLVQDVVAVMGVGITCRYSCTNNRR